jgi:CRISPR/Cas system-associated protein Csm6
MFDAKGLAASIVKGKDPEASDAGEMSEKELAAEDILAAFAENDPKALAAGLDSFFAAAEAEPHVEAGESSEEDESAGV